ncbi:hypothetical protein ERJ75_001078500 [Trypanosoma vivax]|nr:hypothetical protein ERJ75_001078500 [Trypanosoma vivax]
MDALGEIAGRTGKWSRSTTRSKRQDRGRVESFDERVRQTALLTEPAEIEGARETTRVKEGCPTGIMAPSCAALPLWRPKEKESSDCMRAGRSHETDGTKASWESRGPTRERMSAPALCHARGRQKNKRRRKRETQHKENGPGMLASREKRRSARSHRTAS